MLIDVENAMMYAVCSGIEREDVGNPDNVAVVRKVMVGFDSGIGIDVGVGISVIATVGVGSSVIATVGVGISVGTNVGTNVGTSLDEDITNNDTEYCVTLTEPTMEIY